MGVYSIKDLENFTQIKAHTLRIWEQRYNLLNPERTETNIRLYSDRDLKKILNINLLYNNGLKISKIAKLKEEEIFEMANEILMLPVENEISSVDGMINRIINFDEVGIREELNGLCKSHELELVFSELLIPVLKKVGELWQVDSITVTHEHFFSNIIRDFLITQTNALKSPKKTKATVVLFLEENEYHELGLLFYNYYLRKRNFKTIYLGQAVPTADLCRIMKEINPDYVFTSLIAKMDEKQFLEFFDGIAQCCSLSKVYAGGYQLNIFEDLIPEGVNVVHSVDTIGLD